MIELILDNKDGQLWDIGNIATDITWQTTRIGKAGSLQFTLIKGGLYESASFSVSCGDIVRFRYDKQNVFYGYVFSVDGGRDEKVRITAYDQIRYLMSSDTYVFTGATAADVIQRIAKDAGLKVGAIDAPAYKIPSMVADGEKLLDIIDKALTLTIINDGGNYVFFDDFGALSLRLVDNMMVGFMIGDGSLMYDYSFKQSIDQDTYNKIKLVRDNKETGKRDVYVAQDSANIAKWGLLQYHEKVNEKMNDAQIKQLLDALAALKNRETKSLTVNSLGQLGVRAGSYLPIVIEEYKINQPFLVNTCTHRFNGDHTMTLELMVV
ncbi:hypothetical protein SAMN04487969_11979 [Paenibacillus algorifonticola]|uniref:YqbQ/XkdQ domain-containing protein n=1 Tax=Paenibacillus algorifonticola TaxID=684063 RepID=A0A1I2H1C7_9BACL|nr:phage-like element PBSX protein XkdQ [Paenibacillus algorifonticola]SFF23200.1 hypothetical protein SAMN04487969_11979 [Paenibacillus algorifonticola]